MNTTQPGKKKSKPETENKPESKTDFETEKWLDIPIKEYSERYWISSFGRLKSKRTNKIAAINSKKGYIFYNLMKDRKKLCTGAHILVALAFIGEKPSEKHTVNHKDGNKENNKVENLEWTTCSKQMLHAHSNGLIDQYKVPVLQYTMEGEFIKKWSSPSEAGKALKIDQSGIYKVCVGKYNYSGGFKWAFEKPREEEEKFPEDAKEIPGFRPDYRITPEGILYTSSRKRIRRLKPQKGSDGYLVIRLHHSTERRIKKRVHQLVAETFLELPDSLKNCSKIEIDHKDGNKLNNNLNNLEYVSNSENQLRAHKKRREKQAVK